MSLLLGIDLGTSFVKIAVVDGGSGECNCTVQYPEQEMEINSKEPGWAEQDPVIWWENICTAIKIANTSRKYDPQRIAAIGIACQILGIILIDRERNPLRPSFIWCDSRSTDTKKCPAGNFMASRLAWVQQNEPEIYQHIDKAISPGDYIAVKLSGELTTTPLALTEGRFRIPDRDKLSSDIFRFHGYQKSLIPPVRDVFAIHGNLQKDIAEALGLSAYIPISYKAFSGVRKTPVELSDTSVAVGAAVGAGIGAGLLPKENAFENLRPVQRMEPANNITYNDHYELWKQSLISRL